MLYNVSMNQHTSPNDENRQQPILIAAAEVARLLGISIRTVWRMRDAGTLPQPLRLGNKLVRWQRGDIANYLNDLGFNRRP